MFTDLLVITALSALIMSLFCIVSLRQDKLTWIDAAWSAAMGLSAVALFFCTTGDAVRRGVVALLVASWAFRLTHHLVRHRLNGPEDGRYVDLKASISIKKGVYMPALYAIETLLVPLCLIPIHAVMSISTPFGTLWDVLGLTLYCVAIGGEALADAQLETFRSNPGNQKRTCRNGLWRYSRHPNYFFEWTHWWAYVVMAIGTSAFAITLSGPVVMFLFLYYITGIPHIERRALKSRAEDYQQYQKTTSIFFPWIPKQAVNSE